MSADQLLEEFKKLPREKQLQVYEQIKQEQSIERRKNGKEAANDGR